LECIRSNQLVSNTSFCTSLSQEDKNNNRCNEYEL
jgi:hypothetical protein